MYKKYLIESKPCRKWPIIYYFSSVLCWTNLNYTWTWKEDDHGPPNIVENGEEVGIGTPANSSRGETGDE